MAEHDAETIRVGRENIARIRAQLASKVAPISQEPAQTTQPATPPPSAPTTYSEPSLDQMRVEMAIASEREQLLATIRQRDERIAQLETTLAAILRAAADGVDSSPGPHESIDATTEPPDR